MKIRIKFKKYGVMKFIGHLDIMRFFQKAIRRSGLDICYSEGFSPHQIMSFAAPLGVGLTSDGEYLDIEVHTTASSMESMEALNSTMVEGLEIIGYVQLPEHAKTAMSVVAAADYHIFYKEGYDCPLPYEKLHEGLKAFFEDPKEVLVKKKTKKSEKVINLKELVYELLLLQSPEVYGGQPYFYLNVSTGSTDNLKPELVIEEFYRSLGQGYDPFAFQVHRKDVYYMDENGSRRTLLEAGTEIT